MVNPKELKSLSDDEQKQADAAEAVIDKQVLAEFEADPSQTSFTIDRAKLSKAVKGLKVKVRNHLVETYGKNGWKVELTEDAKSIVLKMKRRGGGRPKGSKNGAKSETPEPAAAAAA